MITYDLKSHHCDKTYTFEAYSLMIDGRRCFFAHDGTAPTRTVSLHDRSVIDPFKYNSKCTSCYLGHSHSKEYHDFNLLKITG